MIKFWEIAIEKLDWIVYGVWSYLVIPIILGIGLYFTIFSGFLQIRLFPQMLRVLNEGFKGQGSSRHKAGISSFQAFAISIASRVGTGNLAGVATAIIMGGPGSIFWMWVMAFLGMASSFVESTLAQVYKVSATESGYFRGGPAFYLKNALKNDRLAIIFSILMVITFGYIFSMIQSNTVAGSFGDSFGIDGRYTAVIFSILVAIILLGGIKSIASFSSFFVPIMAISYILVGLIVIVLHYRNIPRVFNLIISDAFNFSAAGGAVFGNTIMHGLRRGLFSNEAGVGTAPAAAAAATTSHPAKQGLIQSLSVFTDTIIVCSVTAFIILSSGIGVTKEVEPVVLMQNSLAGILGNISKYYLSIIIFIFALSSIIGNYFYAESSLAYMTQDNKKIQNIFKITVVLIVFLGALVNAMFIWVLADLFSGLMAIVNFYAITKLFSVAKNVLKDFTKQLKMGVNPQFRKSIMPDTTGVVCWNDE